MTELREWRIRKFYHTKKVKEVIHQHKEIINFTFDVIITKKKKKGHCKSECIVGRLNERSF